VVKKIKEATNGKLKHVLDCVAEGDSTKLSAECLGPEGGIYTALLRTPEEQHVRKDVEFKFAVAYDVFGYAYKLMNKIPVPARPDQHELGARLWHLTETLLEVGTIQIPRLVILEKGLLENVKEGYDLLKNGKVSGQKVVMRISDS